MNHQTRYINENQVSEITKMALSTLRNNRSKGQGKFQSHPFPRFPSEQNEKASSLP